MTNEVFDTPRLRKNKHVSTFDATRRVRLGNPLFVFSPVGRRAAARHRYSLRLDGFASIRADYNGGELLTKRLTFTGSRLDLNFSTSAVGSIRIEIQDESGQPIPGFAAADCVDVIGNEIDRSVRWKSGSDVSSLAGKTVRLRFVMKDADLFALQFIEIKSE